MRWHFMSTLEFNKDAPVLIIEVTLQQGEIQKKIRMALDTGATNLLITQEIAEALGITISEQCEWKEVVTASGIEKVPIIYIDSVKVLDKEAWNVKAVVHNLPEKGYVDGLLGLSFLRQFDLQLNFKLGLLEIN